MGESAISYMRVKAKEMPSAEQNLTKLLINGLSGEAYTIARDA